MAQRPAQRPYKKPRPQHVRKLAPEAAGAPAPKAPVLGTTSLAQPFRFPPAWSWLVDEVIPTYVKKTFSPRDSWKDKPFTADDGRFFFHSIEELSELFTEDRPSGSRGLPDYFAHEKNRSAYLLYFLPLQAAKFLGLFQAHTPAVQAALEHGRKTGVMRIIDLGSGPATASIALCMKLLTLPSSELPPKIEFECFDTSGKILDDARALLDQFVLQFPVFRDRVTVRTRRATWWEYASPPKPGSKKPSIAQEAATPPSLVILGNVLNETGSTQQQSARFAELLSLSAGGGVLVVEPASRRPSQMVSQLRDEMIEMGLIEKKSEAIWGPCLHAGNCPLADGRDWCHFSIPAEIPGKWFKKFSEGLGSERNWLKLSYLWLASKEMPALRPRPEVRRVISDPIRRLDGGGSPGFVLLCEPDQAAKHIMGRESKVLRGDVIMPMPGTSQRPSRPPGRRSERD